jgi:cAMP phosphodiesterase
MVRSYILTEHERKILKRFLENGEKLNGFRTLLTYLRKSHKQLEADLKLINETLQKLREG